MNAKPSIVAMSGAIIPLPLAIAATRTVWPSSCASPPAPFGNVSVVQMASAAARQRLAVGGPSARAACSTANCMALRLSGSPMTPVEAR